VVTLITGDRVTLAPPGEMPPVRFEPAPARERIGYLARRRGDELVVIPRDVAPLVAAGQLDPALFNITALLADGFGDEAVARSAVRARARSQHGAGRARAAWASGATGAGVTVAVLDTGIDATHPDLAGKIDDAQVFFPDGRDAADVHGHDTHVASIVAGTGAASGGAYRGMAPASGSRARRTRAR
jgi:subtilisin family serine protease